MGYTKQKMITTMELAKKLEINWDKIVHRARLETLQYKLNKLKKKRIYPLK